MPLLEGSTDEIISKNIATLIEEDKKPRVQAIAIAMRKAGRQKTQNKHSEFGVSLIDKVNDVVGYLKNSLRAMSVKGALLRIKDDITGVANEAYSMNMTEIGASLHKIPPVWDDEVNKCASYHKFVARWTEPFNGLLEKIVQSENYAGSDQIKRTKEIMNQGLKGWVGNFIVAWKGGNASVAKRLKKDIEGQIKENKLDPKTVWNWFGDPNKPGFKVPSRGQFSLENYAGSVPSHIKQQASKLQGEWKKIKSDNDHDKVRYMIRNWKAFRVAPEAVIEMLKKHGKVTLVNETDDREVYRMTGDGFAAKFTFHYPSARSGSKLGELILNDMAKTKNSFSLESENYNSTKSASKKFKRGSFFNKFFEEKSIPAKTFKVKDSKGGTHLVDNGFVVELIAKAPANEKKQIEKTLRLLDLKNAPINPFLEHLATGYVKTNFSLNQESYSGRLLTVGQTVKVPGAGGSMIDAKIVKVNAGKGTAVAIPLTGEKVERVVAAFYGAEGYGIKAGQATRKDLVDTVNKLRSVLNDLAFIAVSFPKPISTEFVGILQKISKTNAESQLKKLIDSQAVNDHIRSKK